MHAAVRESKCRCVQAGTSCGAGGATMTTTGTTMATTGTTMMATGTVRAPPLEPLTAQLLPLVLLHFYCSCTIDYCA